jgi:hypothetical protein
MQCIPDFQSQTQKRKGGKMDGRIEQDGKKGIAVMPGDARKGKTKLNWERRM